MNPAKLRRSLRAGGWERAARNLPTLIVQEGLPLTRHVSGRTVRIQLEPSGELSARLLDDAGCPVIATEQACEMPMEAAPVRPKPSAAGTVVTLRLDEALLARVDRRTRRRASDSRSALIRRAITNYLDAVE